MALVAVVAVVAGSFATAGEAGAARRGVANGCPPIGPRTLVADAMAEVYEAGPSYAPGLSAVPNGLTTYRGCAFGHRSFSAGFGPLGGSLSGLTIAGRFAAFWSAGGWRASARVAPEYTVAVWNLLSGEMRSFDPCQRGADQVPGGGPVTSLVVESGGAVAWICASAAPGGPYYEVHAVDDGGARTLAAGAGIDPASLATSAQRVYWTQDGAAQSAPLS